MSLTIKMLLLHSYDKYVLCIVMCNKNANGFDLLLYWGKM